MNTRNQTHILRAQQSRGKFDRREKRLGIACRGNDLTASETTKTRRPTTEEEILVPVNFSDGCDYAVDVAIDMATTLNCGVLLAHVAGRIYGNTFLDSGQRELSQKQSVEAATEKLVRFADVKRNRNVPIRCVVKTGLPSYELLRLAETENAKWIVMARTPRNVISRVFSGSVSGDIVDCSPCPVLIVNNFGRRRSA